MNAGGVQNRDFAVSCYAHEHHIYLPDWYGDSRTVEISIITHNLTPVWRPRAFRSDADDTAHAASPTARFYCTACNIQRQIHAQHSEMRVWVCGAPCGSIICARTCTHTTYGGTPSSQVAGSPTDLRPELGPPICIRRVEMLPGMIGKGLSTSGFDCGRDPVDSQGIREVRDGRRV